MSQEDRSKKRRLVGFSLILIIGIVIFFVGIILADVAGAAVASALGIGVMKAAGG